MEPPSPVISVVMPCESLAEGAIVDQERGFGLAEHVNEAGGDDAALGIDFALGMGFAQIAIAASRSPLTATSAYTRDCQCRR